MVGEEGPLLGIGSGAGSVLFSGRSRCGVNPLCIRFRGRGASIFPTLQSSLLEFDGGQYRATGFQVDMCPSQDLSYASTIKVNSCTQLDPHDGHTKILYTDEKISSRSFRKCQPNAIFLCAPISLQLRHAMVQLRAVRNR